MSKKRFVMPGTGRISRLVKKASHELPPFQPDPALKFPIAITIAIEKLIRINQALIFNFQSNLA